MFASLWKERPDWRRVSAFSLIIYLAAALGGAMAAQAESALHALGRAYQMNYYMQQRLPKNATPEQRTELTRKVFSYANKIAADEQTRKYTDLSKAQTDMVKNLRSYLAAQENEKRALGIDPPAGASNKRSKDGKEARRKKLAEAELHGKLSGPLDARLAGKKKSKTKGHDDRSLASRRGGASAVPGGTVNKKGTGRDVATEVTGSDGAKGVDFSKSAGQAAVHGAGDVGGANKVDFGAPSGK